MTKFVHLHTHSHYSLLDGLSQIPDLVARVKELGMDMLAVTDHGVLYGAVEFYKTARKAGIKPILGMETYVAPKSRLARDSNERYYHLILLAENDVGWHNLIQLSTKAHLEGFYYKPRVDKELLREHHAGLIATSACLGGELSQLLLQGEYDTAKRVALEYRDIFGAGNYFLEHGEHPHIPDAVKVKPLLIQLARETGIPLVAAQDSHYLRPEDGEYHDVLLAVQTSNRLADDDRLSMKADNFAILSPDEMAAKYADLPEAIENTVRIGERCNVTLELDKVILPDFPKPEGETADQYLRELVETRLPGRFPERAVAPEVRERLEFELGVIQKTGYADYFLIVQDLINWAKTHGIAVGPGRGSAAGSLVSYVLGITGVNPLTYDLLFERFLNPDRIQMPDIDMDFADKRRDEVIAYVRQKYGSDRVAQIITFGTMAARAAIRDAGRAMGLPYNLCDQVAKLIPFNMNLAEAIKKVPELAEFYQNPETKKLLDTARHLEGVARHASVHACGIVISKEPLVNIVPLQLAPQDKDSIVTQLEMHSIEDLGLLKMDFLGLRNLTTIEETVRLVRELHGETIDIANIPLNDPATFTLLQRADTSGVFQFECLSGDTMISNTTLKKLYERRNRKTLESVYVDEGKVHRNTILGIAKSGKKDVYTLIADNNWFIKATAEHSFLTENGWKKLKNIRPGEKVLLRTKARHLVYNTCLTCRKQIDGQKNGKSRFCYACSAAHFKNPSKDISRTKMREARRNFFRNGGRTWNLGVTTENNEVWRETARKISQALTGVSIEDRWGAERATEIKRRFSERFRGAGNPMFGRRSPHRKGGIRPDLGHYVRSNWEADFARILNYFKTGYQYEPKTFRLTRGDGSAVSYTPDFYVPTTNTFYEIKGWLHELDQEKMDLFQTQYPEYNFVLVNKTKFAELALQYRDLVAWECPKIPEKNFEFVKVREVKYSGIEETYDIAMQAPGNNFVANGFVVHNSSGMRRYMKDIHPTELEDLVALVALFRPGPMELIPSYIKRKNGEEKIAYLHPKLEPILKNTYGIGVYQEQMMRIARDLAGYTLSEADTLRKAIGKKIKSLLDEQEEKLVAGMTKNGIAPKAAKAIWELFPPFARYGFNRCVTGDTQINDPVTGQLVAVEELFRDKTRLAQTYSIDQGGKVFTNGITDILDNGPKDVYSVKTKSGRKIKATANHPLLTPQGWRKLEDIEAGTRIAVPRILPEPAQPLAAQHHRAALLGYLLAEGNLCHPHGFYFYSASEAEITDYIQNLEKFDNTVAVIDRSKPAASVYAKRKDVKRISAAVAWVESLGMKNKTATQKTIPDWACRLANEDLAVLIAKMFQGDGCLHLRGVNPQIYYATSSHRLAQGLQHLLLRFGILSTIHQKGFKYRGTIKPGYTVSIGRHDNIGKFIANFMQHFVGQKQAVAREILRGHPILNQLPRSKLTRYELKTTQVVSFRPPHQVRGELGAACPPPAENPGGNTEWIPDIF
ncbi:MAG: DNA polymerase III subunit alpha, partial [Candidatus Liptonbacteria bacterium]|nr:DNA polymerase III subunit alpha [Candidatus Liptonbacteria bacterium]